jgi:hypothetical protein
VPCRGFVYKGFFFIEFGEGRAGARQKASSKGQPRGVRGDVFLDACGFSGEVGMELVEQFFGFGGLVHSLAYTM